VTPWRGLLGCRTVMVRPLRVTDSSTSGPPPHPETDCEASPGPRRHHPSVCSPALARRSRSLRDAGPARRAAPLGERGVHVRPRAGILPRAAGGARILEGPRRARPAGTRGARLTGVLQAWIEIGAPDAARLHRASKAAPTRGRLHAHRRRSLLGLACRRAHPPLRVTRAVRARSRLGGRARLRGWNGVWRWTCR